MTAGVTPDPAAGNPASRLTVLAEGHELAQMYDEAVRDLNRHWPDENGECIDCGDTYPCAEEWITQRAITGIETRWRRQSHLLAGLTAPPSAATTTPAAPPAAGPPSRTGESMNLADAKFRRASGCDNSSGSCLEVAMLGDTIITRDSKDPQGTVQAYTRTEWTTFIDAVKAGEFDA